MQRTPDNQATGSGDPCNIQQDNEILQLLGGRQADATRPLTTYHRRSADGKLGCFMKPATCQLGGLVATAEGIQLITSKRNVGSYMTSD